MVKLKKKSCLNAKRHSVSHNAIVSNRFSKYKNASSNKMIMLENLIGGQSTLERKVKKIIETKG